MHFWSLMHLRRVHFSVRTWLKMKFATRGCIIIILRFFFEFYFGFAITILSYSRHTNFDFSIPHSLLCISCTTYLAWLLARGVDFDHHIAYAYVSMTWYVTPKPCIPSRIKTYKDLIQPLCRFDLHDISYWSINSSFTRLPYYEQLNAIEVWTLACSILFSVVYCVLVTNILVHLWFQAYIPKFILHNRPSLNSKFISKEKRARTQMIFIFNV